MNGNLRAMVARMYAENGYKEYGSADGPVVVNGYQMESLSATDLEFSALEIEGVDAATITAMLGRVYPAGAIIPGHVKGFTVSAGIVRVYKRS